ALVRAPLQVRPQASLVESRAVTPKIMHLMNCFLDKAIGAADYAYRVNEWLDRPLDDKRAQRVLQAACYDLSRLNDTTHQSIEIHRCSGTRS
ncbi:MAG TPA: hypothetical protein VHQ22_04680, partial [Terriglobales bacterium]|nr:hypothetical protein [Terriglobales bacterium]